MFTDCDDFISPEIIGKGMLDFECNSKLLPNTEAMASAPAAETLLRKNADTSSKFILFILPTSLECKLNRSGMST